MTMIDQGTYRARGISAGLGEADTGTKQVAVLLELPDVGETIYWYGYFTEKTEEKTLEGLIALGWTGNDLDDLTGIDQNEVTVTIKHETFDGETRAKVAWINSGAGPGLKRPLDGNAAKAFSARMKGKVLAMRQKMGSTPNAAPRHTTQTRPSNAPPPSTRADDAPAFGDDDIPF